LADILRDVTRWKALDLMWLEDPVWPPEALLDCPALLQVAIGLGPGSVRQSSLRSKEEHRRWA
jgi:hypothetical protein